MGLLLIRWQAERCVQRISCNDEGAEKVRQALYEMKARIARVESAYPDDDVQK